MLRCLLPLVLALAIAGTARAQMVELEPSAVAACLAPLPGASDQPEYPFAAYKFDKPGRVLVELLFTGAELRPAVEVISNEGESDFVQAVREHVRNLRVPCLPPGRSARLRQEYVFQADGRPVLWGRAVDSADTGRRELLRCMKHLSGQKHPDYPPAMLREGQQARLLATVTFTSDDQAPKAEVWSRPGASHFASVIREWLRGYRLPCYGGEPISASLKFVFRLGDDAFGFKPMNLLGFAANTRRIRTEGLQMDTRTMGCPFDLKLEYRQPLRPNLVGVVGPADVRRQPLIDWLQRTELDLSSRMTDSVFADVADIHVPCVNLAIPPRA